MLTALEQNILDLREQGIGFREVARRVGTSYGSAKFVAWYARQKLANGDPPPKQPNTGTYCVFRFGEYVGALPLRLLPDWQARVWAAREHLPWLATLTEPPALQILLGGAGVALTWKEAAAARRVLVPSRQYSNRPAGVIKIDPAGTVTKYRTGREAARAEGMSHGEIRQRWQHGADRAGDYWL